MWFFIFIFTICNTYSINIPILNKLKILNKLNIQNQFFKFKNKTILNISDQVQNYTINNETLSSYCQEFDSNSNLNWYVIDENKNLLHSKLYKTTIFNKEYVFWKDRYNKLYAMSNICNHRGASLFKGKLINNHLVCPYHGLTFNQNGILSYIPGVDTIEKLPNCYYQESYNIIQKNGWIYLNIIDKNESQIFFEEEESHNSNLRVLYSNVNIQTNARIVCENLLDILHISNVHSFGNVDHPHPSNIPVIQKVNDTNYHYKISYNYISGNNSIVKKIYSIDNITIENEFILPYTIISRVKFGEFIKTITSFALPINESSTQLFVKIYRNYLFFNESDVFSNLYNNIADKATMIMLTKTLEEDKNILENIDLKNSRGKYNLKFDKFRLVIFHLTNC